MAETMAEILSPLFLPFVRQKYLSARQTAKECWVRMFETNVTYYVYSVEAELYDDSKIIKLLQTFTEL